MQNILKALAAAQAEMPALQKNAINPHFKNTYISLDALMEAVLPVLQSNGIILLQFPTAVSAGGPAQPGLTTILAHSESGESISDTMLLCLDRDNPQGQGSAITYARRYSLMSILGLVADEDDDGERATKATYTKESSTGGW